MKKTELAGEKAVWKYEYDLLNRLVKVLKNGQTVAEYMYDEGGLRIKKTGPKEQVYYVFDTGGNVLYEQENREYMEYVYVLGKHFARIDGNLDSGIEKKYFYHTDHLGSTVVVTDEAGEKVWDTEYTPFGKTAAVEGELKNVVKFTGKDFDADIGLYYYNSRWYDQDIGRFISEDLISKLNIINLYWYCNNNPIINIDPDGREATRADQRIFEAWFSSWTIKHNIAVNAEKAQRYAIWKQDPVAYAENRSLFNMGKRDVFGAEYQATVDLLDTTTAIMGAAPQVQNWIKNQISKGHTPTTEEINNKAAEIAKANEDFETYMAPIIYGVIAWAQMGATGKQSRSNSNNVKIVEQGTSNIYAELAKKATQNAESSDVVLGKYSRQGLSYEKVAERKGATYFEIDNWNEVSSKIGEENMWKINFYFSHNPWEATGYFQREILHLIDLGVKDFIQVGDMWKAVK